MQAVYNFVPTPTQPIPPLFGDYVDFWLDTYKRGDVKDSSYGRLKTSREALEGYAITMMNVCDITVRHIKAYLDEMLKNNYTMSTVKKQLRIVTAPLKFAAANHWIPSDPTYGIKVPPQTKIKKKSKDVEAYEGAQYDRIRKLLESEAHDAYCAALLMDEMGLRPGEAIALDWDDVNMERRIIRIHKTYVRDTETGGWYIQDEPKTVASNRPLPIPDFAFSMLQRLYERRRGEQQAVFLSVFKVRMSYESMRFQIKNACEKVNVPYKGLHVFRHTFATRKYHEGVDVKKLCKWLGHSNTSVTYNTYIHLYGDSVEELRDTLR